MPAENMPKSLASGDAPTAAPTQIWAAPNNRSTDLHQIKTVNNSGANRTVSVTLRRKLPDGTYDSERNMGTPSVLLADKEHADWVDAPGLQLDPSDAIHCVASGSGVDFLVTGFVNDQIDEGI